MHCPFSIYSNQTDQTPEIREKWTLIISSLEADSFSLENGHFEIEYSEKWTLLSIYFKMEIEQE
jgi:hypothetical protein